MNRKLVALAMFAVLTGALTACGGDDEPAPAGTATHEPIVKGKGKGTGTGTFTLTGVTSMKGALTNVSCVTKNPGNYTAFGYYSPEGKTVVVSVEVAGADTYGDQQENNFVSIDGGGKLLYNRFSSGDKPLANSRDGSHIRAHVTLMDARDMSVEDRAKRRYVDLTADFDCGDQLP